LLSAAAVAGIAAALGYRGSLQVVNTIAPGEQRSEVISSYLITMYLGNSVPVIGVGLLTQVEGPLAAHATFAAVIATFALAAILVGVRYGPKSP